MNEEKEYRDTLKNNIAVIEYYGIKKQMPVWIEEMSELTKNICKWARKYDELGGNIPPQLFCDLREEITDVTICLDQLKYAIHFIEEDLMKEYKWKVDRQLKRIEEQK